MRVHSLRSLAFVPVACLAAVLACGNEAGPLAELGIEDGARHGEARSAMVSADTGATLSLATGARLQIPRGALDRKLEVSIERPNDDEAYALVRTLNPRYLASAPYVLRPHGAQFRKEVQLTLPIAKSDARALVVAWRASEQDERWRLLDAATIAGASATIKLQHFSVVVLLEGEKTLDAGSEAGLDAGGEVAYGQACVSTSECADNGVCAVMPSESYCTQRCVRSAECSPGFACAATLQGALCVRAPVGYGRACSRSADCSGSQASYCEALQSRSCVIQCGARKPCPRDWSCCNFSLFPVSLCMPAASLVQGVCPGGGALVTPLRSEAEDDAWSGGSREADAEVTMEAGTLVDAGQDFR